MTLYFRQTWPDVGGEEGEMQGDKFWHIHCGIQSTRAACSKIVLLQLAGKMSATLGMERSVWLLYVRESSVVNQPRFVLLLAN